MMEMKENETHKAAQIKEVINCDMTKQEVDFKKKLEAKRMKSILSTSEIMDNVNVILIK